VGREIGAAIFVFLVTALIYDIYEGKGKSKADRKRLSLDFKR